MKWVLYIIGVLLILMGVVWFLQGVNILPGSFMSGKILYSFLGIIVGAIGVGLIYLGNRRRRITGGGDTPKT